MDVAHFSRGGLIGGTIPVQLVPDDQFDPLRWDQVAYSESVAVEYLQRTYSLSKPPRVRVSFTDLSQ